MKIIIAIAVSLLLSGVASSQDEVAYNYKQDEIQLEKEWVQNNKKCFLLRINNQFEGQKTTYAYALNEDMNLYGGKVVIMQKHTELR